MNSSAQKYWIVVVGVIFLCFSTAANNLMAQNNEFVGSLVYSGEIIRYTNSYSVLLDVYSQNELSAYIIENGIRKGSYNKKKFRYKIESGSLKVNCEGTEVSVFIDRSKTYFRLKGQTVEAINIIPLFEKYLSKYRTVNILEIVSANGSILLPNVSFVDFATNNKYLVELTNTSIIVRDLDTNLSKPLFIENSIHATKVFPWREKFLLLSLPETYSEDNLNSISILDPILGTINKIWHTGPKSVPPIRPSVIGFDYFSNVLWVYEKSKKGVALWRFNSEWTDCSHFVNSTGDSVRAFAFDENNTILFGENTVTLHEKKSDIVDNAALEAENYPEYIYTHGNMHCAASGLGSVYVNTATKTIRQYKTKTGVSISEHECWNDLNNIGRHIPWIYGRSFCNSYQDEWRDPLLIGESDLFANYYGPLEMKGDYYLANDTVHSKNGRHYPLHKKVTDLKYSSSFGPFSVLSTGNGFVIHDSRNDTYHIYGEESGGEETACIHLSIEGTAIVAVGIFREDSEWFRFRIDMQTGNRKREEHRYGWDFDENFKESQKDVYMDNQKNLYRQHKDGLIIKQNK